jgi:hypothetical protein
MPSYLITFKPSHESPGKGFPLPELQELVNEFKERGSLVVWWRFANSHAQPGDRVFFLCQGKLGPAIIGNGTLDSSPVKRDEVWRAPIRFEKLVDPTISPLLSPNQLKTIPNAAQYWRTQLSGIKVDDETANGIQELLIASQLNVASIGSEEAEDGLEKDDEYKPVDGDEREQIKRQIRARRGQRTFRDKLRLRYANQCVISSCRILDVLEAAHIRAYRGPKDNHPANGLLLRADLHTLFDLNLIGIDPTSLRVHINPSLKGSEYKSMQGRGLNCSPSKKPSREALEERWKNFREALTETGTRE